MLYRLFAPTSELADIVACYWYVPIEPNCYSKQQYNTPLFECMVFNFTKLKESHLHEGKTIYISKTAYIFGQTKSVNVISGLHENGGSIIGVRFKPLGLAKITGINMLHFANKVVDAEDVWGDELGWLCEAMQEANSIEAAIMVLEGFLKKQLRATQLHYRVDQVAGAIALMQAHKGSLTSEELQDMTNTGRKTLERAFMNFHGLMPKTYNKIIRFNTARQLMDAGFNQNLTKLAYDLGYFDQSHFIKDFKRFSGQTPTGYLKTIEGERRKRTLPVD